MVTETEASVPPDGEATPGRVDNQNNSEKFEANKKDDGLSDGNNDAIENSSESSGDSDPITLKFQCPIAEPSQLTVATSGFTGPYEEVEATQESLALLPPPMPNVTPAESAPRALLWMDSERNFFPIIPAPPAPPVPPANDVNIAAFVPPSIQRRIATEDSSLPPARKPAPGAEYEAIYGMRTQDDTTNLNYAETDDDEENSEPQGDLDIPVEGESDGVAVGAKKDDSIPDVQITKPGPNDWMRNDELYHFFKSRTKENGNAGFKRDLLMTILDFGGIQLIFPRNFIQNHPKEVATMAELEEQLRSTLIRREKSWKVPFLATVFRNLAKWVRICDRLGYTRRRDDPKPMKELRKYLEKCHARLRRNNIIDDISIGGKLNDRSTTRGLGKNIGQQPSHHLKNGTTVQHEMIDKLGDNWIKMIVAKFSCPWCGYQLVITERETREKLLQKRRMLFTSTKSNWQNGILSIVGQGRLTRLSLRNLPNL